MVKKKKESRDGFRTVKYVSKPTERDYQRAYKRTSTPEQRKMASDYLDKRAEAYDKQRAKIAVGDMDSKSKYRTKMLMSKVAEGLKKAAKTKVISRRVLKDPQMKVKIPYREVPSVLGDENRFFKGEMEAAKKSLYFS